jgi:hypothetical protein
MDINDIKNKIAAEVAAGVVAKLPEEVKGQIVAEAMKDVISDYDFKRAVEAKLKGEADCRLDGLLKTVKFDENLQAKFQEGIDIFMAALPKAVATAMVGMLVGPNRYKHGAVYQGLCAVLGLDPTE